MNETKNSEFQVVDQFKDPLWRIQNLYLIRDKTHNKRKMQFNNAQKRIVSIVGDKIRKGLPINHYDLKYRQGGVSTFWVLFYLDNMIFNPNTINVIIAQKQESLNHLWDIVRIAHETMPDSLRPELEHDTSRTLSIKGTHSKIMVSLKVQSTVL